MFLLGRYDMLKYLNHDSVMVHCFLELLNDNFFDIFDSNVLKYIIIVHVFDLISYSTTRD